LAFVVILKSPPPAPQIGNSMHGEWYKLCPCLGVFSGHWKSMFPTNLADIFVLILSHSVQELKKLNTNIDWASHIVFCRLQIFLGTWGIKDLGFQTLIRLVPIQHIVLFPPYWKMKGANLNRYGEKNKNIINLLKLLVGCNEWLNACTLPRVSSGNFFKSRKILGKHVLFSVKLCFFKLKFAICTKPKIERG
jgi:hypothetical protein